MARDDGQFFQRCALPKQESAGRYPPAAEGSCRVAADHEPARFRHADQPESIQAAPVIPR